MSWIKKRKGLTSAEMARRITPLCRKYDWHYVQDTETKENLLTLTDGGIAITSVIDEDNLEDQVILMEAKLNAHKFKEK